MGKTAARRIPRSIFSLVCVLVAAIAAEAAAQCTTAADAIAVRRSVNRAVRCNDRFLRVGPSVPCVPIPPPACAGTLVEDAVALAYGENNPTAAGVDRVALRDQLICQRRIGAAVAAYVRRKLRLLVAGVDPTDADTRARRRLDALPKRCTVGVLRDESDVVLPSVGPQCGSAVGDPGANVDPSSLADCLHTLLEVWVDRWGPNPQPLRPNFLVVLTDDQRWDTTRGEHGPGGADIMPLTRAELAGSGVEFENAFITTPVCCPSRSSILCGQYAHTHGVFVNQGVHGGADDFDHATNVATWIEGPMAAGYRTGFVGKYLNQYNQLWNAGETPFVPPGWSMWSGMKNVAYYDYTIVEDYLNDALPPAEVSYGSAPDDYSTDVLREIARSFIIDSVNLGQPFFLYFAPKAPHLPKIPAPRHNGMFAALPPWRPASYNEADVSDKPSWVQALPLLTAQEQANLDEIRIRQLEMLQAVDEAIGGSAVYGITGLMQTLRDLGVDRDTIVIFLGDNGWQWGEHRMDKKNKPYEESIRTPMMIRYPRLAPLPRVETRLTLNIDLAPTIAELAGATPPIPVEGESLVRLLDGTAPSWRTDLLTEGWPADHVWATVRDERWKYTELPTFEVPPAPAFELELYDLQTDPLELDNLAGDPNQIPRMDAMATRLRELRPLWPADADRLFDDPDE